jgi:hypothetical protein
MKLNTPEKYIVLCYSLMFLVVIFFTVHIIIEHRKTKEKFFETLKELEAEEKRVKEVQKENVRLLKLFREINYQSTIELINIGKAPNDRTGDPIVVAFYKVNTNSILFDSLIRDLQTRVSNLE